MSDEGHGVLIIGGVAAGTKTAARLRRLNRDVAITVVTDEPYISYGGCGEPYYVGDEIADVGQLIHRTPEYFAEREQIQVLTHHRAMALDLGDKVAYVRDLQEGLDKQMPFDWLVIASGASPIRPPLPGVDLDGVFTVRAIDDVVAIKERIGRGEVSSAVVVGAGFIGLEMAENLTRRGVAVTVVELAPRVAPTFDAEVGQAVAEALDAHGVRIVTGRGVDEIVGDGTRVTGVRVGVETVPADMVLLAVGVQPNSVFVAEAGIETGVRGAIVVDGQLRTNVPFVFAGGDVVQATQLVTGEPAWYPLGDTANQHGRIIGTNLAMALQGLEPMSTLPPRLGTNIFQVFELAVGSTGLTEEQASKAGLDYAGVVIRGRDRPGYMPGVKDVRVKLLAERGSGRLLGAQAWGTGKVDKLLDTLATALTFRGTVDDLITLDLAYAPPFAPALGLPIVAASVLEKQL